MVKKNNLAYFELLLIFFIPILYLSAHYLLTIFYFSPDNPVVWMGIEVNGLIIDVVLYLGLFLTVILFFLIIQRNFILKKRKVRR